MNEFGTVVWTKTKLPRMQNAMYRFVLPQNWNRVKMASKWQTGGEGAGCARAGCAIVHPIFEDFYQISIKKRTKVD